MCGILGSVNVAFDEKTLSLMNHRGPDDYGMASFELSKQQIKLAHKRLSIVDLSQAGHQPMSSFCNNFSIIFNGEIYNHLDLRKKLVDISFKGTSDTETILNYIGKFGIESIIDFNGIFSLAILDKKKAKLHLARDPFGVKPLYFFESENKCVFSSEIKPILKLFPNLTINKKIIAEILKLRYAPSPDTLFEKIKKVPPGVFITVDFSKKKITYKTERYTKNIPETAKISFQEALNKYEFYFENAVKRQLQSDVEIGILLSGGLDSAMVAFYAQKHSKGKLKAFTIGFEENDSADEIQEAIETAQFLKLDHFCQKINFDEFLSLIQKSVNIVEEPLGTTSIIPMFCLTALAGKHVTVVLTGQGADEPLGGYKRHQLEVLFSKIPKVIRPLLTLVFKNSKSDSLRRGAKAFAFQNYIDRLLSTYTLFSDTDIKNLIDVEETYAKEKITTMINLLNFDAKKTNVDKNLSLDLRLNLADDLLLYTDKISMYHSVEARVPILDLELISFLESLPQDFKVMISRTKILHKALAKRILPREIVNRKKKGFKSPTKIWFENYNDQVLKLLTDATSQFSLYFNVDEVAKIIKSHKKGINKEKEIFLLLNFYYWFKDFKH